MRDRFQNAGSFDCGHLVHKHVNGRSRRFSLEMAAPHPNRLIYYEAYLLRCPEGCEALLFLAFQIFFEFGQPEGLVDKLR
jgi:hypothetical protein